MTRSQGRYSRLDQELHQPRVPTGGSSMQRCPQLTVAGVDAGTGVQQALHHLHKVIDATLRVSARKHSAESELCCRFKAAFHRQTTTHVTLALGSSPLLGKHQVFQEGGQRFIKALLCSHISLSYIYSNVFSREHREMNEQAKNQKYTGAPVAVLI